MAMPFEVNDGDFEEQVLDNNQPVLVDFWADWCPPCKMLEPIVEELAAQFDGILRVAKLDADENPNTTQIYDVSGLPTLILFKGGRAVERITGYTAKNKLVERLSPHIE